MKKYFLFLLVFFSSTFGCISYTYAYQVDIPSTMIQGDTIKLDMGRFDILTATVKLGENTFRFYPVTLPIDDTSPLTKREFLKYIFKNTIIPTEEHLLYTIYDLPKTDTDYALLSYLVNNGLVSPTFSKKISADSPILASEARKILPKNTPLKFAGTYVTYKDMGMPHTSTGVFLRSYIAPHRQSSLGEKTLVINFVTKNGEKKSIEKKISILPGSFRISRFSLSADRYALFGKEAQDNTWDKVDAARKTSNPKQLWTGVFLIPIKGKETSHFGDIMYINGVYNGSHFGIDYAAPSGTAMIASNTGNVVLSEYLPSFGNTIIIDHGQDVFTMYLHLSKNVVTVGQHVTKGELIGRVGNTGLSTGPHLHFTFFNKDVIVNNRDWTDGKFQ